MLESVMNKRRALLILDMGTYTDLDIILFNGIQIDCSSIIPWGEFFPFLLDRPE